MQQWNIYTVCSYRKHKQSTSGWSQRNLNRKWRSDILAYLIGRRTPSHAIVVEGHRRRCLQWVSVKPMCHPVDKEEGGISAVTSYSEYIVTYIGVNAACSPWKECHQDPCWGFSEWGGKRQLAFDVSFWLTSFCQCGSLQLSNDGVNSPTERLLSYTAATSTVWSSSYRWFLGFDPQFNADKPQLRKLLRSIGY